MSSEDKKFNFHDNGNETKIEPGLAKLSVLNQKREFEIDTDFFKRVSTYVAPRSWKKPQAKFQKYTRKKFEREPSLSERTWFLSDSVNLLIRTHETAEMLKTLTNSEGKAETIACYVMRTRQAVATDARVTDTRFLAGQGIPRSYATYILAVPIMNFAGHCVGVLELYRENEVPYEADFMEYTSAILQVVAETITQNRKRVTFLSILGDGPSLSKKLNNAMAFAPSGGSAFYYCTIMKYVKKTTDAQKVSIFLVKDNNLQEEITTDDLEGLNKPTLKLELQLANLTLKSGWMLNISDLFCDSRFDKTEELEKGYIIRSVLNLALGGRKRPIGVLQSINKLSGGKTFASCGELALSAFADYCSLWYYYTKVVEYANKLRNYRKMYANNVYSIISKPVPTPEPLDINELTVSVLMKSFNFNLTAQHMIKMPKLILIMIEDVAGRNVFNPEDLNNFINMTRAFYGEYYHGLKNSTQAVQFLFAVLNVYPMLFSHDDEISLMMAAFCSTIHRQYPSLEKLKKTDDPILHVFTDYFVQRFAFKSAKFLIKCSNLFHKMNEKTQEDLINSLEENVLSTNYIIGSEVVKKIKDLTIKKQFDCADLEHQKLLKALLIFITSNHCFYALNAGSFRQYWLDIHKEIITVTEGDEVDKPGDPELQRKTLYAIMVRHMEITVLPYCSLLTKILPNLSDVYMKMVNNCKILTNIVNSDLDLTTAENKFFAEDDGSVNVNINNIVNY